MNSQNRFFGNFQLDLNLSYLLKFSHILYLVFIFILINGALKFKRKKENQGNDEKISQKPSIPSSKRKRALRPTKVVA